MAGHPHTHDTHAGLNILAHRTIGLQSSRGIMRAIVEPCVWLVSRSGEAAMLQCGGHRVLLARSDIKDSSADADGDASERCLAFGECDAVTYAQSYSAVDCATSADTQRAAAGASGTWSGDDSCQLIDVQLLSILHESTTRLMCDATYREIAPAVAQSAAGRGCVLFAATSHSNVILRLTSPAATVCFFLQLAPPLVTALYGCDLPRGGACDLQLAGGIGRMTVATDAHTAAGSATLRLATFVVMRVCSHMGAVHLSPYLVTPPLSCDSACDVCTLQRMGATE